MELPVLVHWDPKQNRNVAYTNQKNGGLAQFICISLRPLSEREEGWQIWEMSDVLLDAPARGMGEIVAFGGRGIEQRLTPEGENWWFGYYDKPPYSRSGKLVAGMRVPFMDRPPEAGEAAEIAVRLADGGDWEVVGRTQAWNWQQGCMLTWNPGAPEDELVFNDVEDGEFVCRAVNVHNGRRRIVGEALYAISPDGLLGASCSFSRLHQERPGYGYAGVPDRFAESLAPEEDGLWIHDLRTGAARLVFSLAEAARFQPWAGSEGKKHRFNHLQFSRDGSRLVFLHRFKEPHEEVGTTRLMTCARDGSGVRLLSAGGAVSHFDWVGSKALVAWSLHAGELAYHLYEDREEGGVVPIGLGELRCDGHCSISPNGEWMMTDTYPDGELRRTLLLWKWPDGPRVELGRFYAPSMPWEIRCDLHPRWSRCGRKVCFDSAHEGYRGIYEMDLTVAMNRAS